MAALVAVIALGLVAIQFLRRDSRQGAAEPDRDGAETEQPSIEGPQLVGRPATRAPLDVLPEAKPEPEVTVPVPGGSLRVVVRVPGRVKGDGTRVMVVVIRDGEALTSLFWAPDLGGFPLGQGQATPLGARAEIVPEPSTSDVEASVLLSDIEDGEYALHAELVEELRGESQAIRQVSVQRTMGATARLVLPSPQEMAALTVRLARGGAPAQAKVKVKFEDYTLTSFETAGSATVSVPAGVDLLVEVSAYQGEWEFPLVPPSRVRLAPRQPKTLTIELPAGVSLTVHALRPDRVEVQFGLSMWRLSETARPRFMGSALEPQAERPNWKGLLPPGRYALRAETRGASAWQTLELEGPGPQELQIQLEAHAGRTVESRWWEADGTPADGLRMTLVREQDPDRLEDQFIVQALTDDEGRVAFPPLRDGVYEVWLWDWNLHRRIAVDSSTPGRLEFRLPEASPPESTASLRGTLRAPSGEAAGASMLIERDDSDWSVVVRPDGGGAFRAAGLEPGPARIRVPFSWYYRFAYRPHLQSIRLERARDNQAEIQLREP